MYEGDIYKTTITSFSSKMALLFPPWEVLFMCQVSCDKFHVSFGFNLVLGQMQTDFLVRDSLRDRETDDPLPEGPRSVG